MTGSLFPPQLQDPGSTAEFRTVLEGVDKEDKSVVVSDTEEPNVAAANFFLSNTVGPLLQDLRFARPHLRLPKKTQRTIKLSTISSSVGPTRVFLIK